MLEISQLIMNSAYAADEAIQKSNSFTSLILIFLITAVFYFLMIRPQQKKNREHQAKLNSIARGDEIITSSGLIGTIINIPQEGDKITIEIAKDVKVQIHRAYIAEFLGKSNDKKVEKKSKKNSSEEKPVEQSE